MAYTRGNNKNILVGAAALFFHSAGPLEEKIGKVSPTGDTIPDFKETESYRETLTADTAFGNFGYTSDGITISFEPDFGEVQVDQLLDSAKLFKQGMQVSLQTVLSEATLENLVIALANPENSLHRPYDKQGFVDPLTGEGEDDPNAAAGADYAELGKYAKFGEAGSEVTYEPYLDSWLDLPSGDIGECPVERGLVAVGPGTGDCALSDQIERVYIAYRALSIENVQVILKRDEETKFDVTFRLLPEDGGSYGKIVDRSFIK
jgi:hypothetical protein